MRKNILLSVEERSALVAPIHRYERYLQRLVKWNFCQDREWTLERLLGREITSNSYNKRDRWPNILKLREISFVRSFLRILNRNSRYFSLSKKYFQIGGGEGSERRRLDSPRSKGERRKKKKENEGITSIESGRDFLIELHERRRAGNFVGIILATTVGGFTSWLRLSKRGKKENLPRSL